MTPKVSAHHWAKGKEEYTYVRVCNVDSLLTNIYQGNPDWTNENFQIPNV
jgi:hypothetical protein